MVPAPLFEVLRRIASGNLPEGRAGARSVELQLLTLEIRVADTQQQILLDTHDGRDVDGAARSVARRKIVEVDKGLVGHGRQTVPSLAAFRILVEGRELDPVVGELRCDGDGRGSFHDIIGDVGTVKHVHRGMADAHGNEIGFVDRKRSRLFLALAHQLLELQGHDIRGCFSRGDRDTLGRQLIVFGIEHRPLRTVTGIVRPDERRVDRERHRHILSRRIGQLRLQGAVVSRFIVAEGCKLHLVRFRDVEINGVSELVVVGLIIIAGREKHEPRDGCNQIFSVFFHGVHYLAGFNVWIAPRIVW